MKYLAGLFAALALAWSAHSQAQGSPQNYPLKPVTLYVGFPAGSTNDSTARTMAHQLAETLGQQFIVIDLVTTSTSLAAPHIQSGRLRAIGVTSSQRSTQLPNVPTMSEAGLPGYELVGWYSMLAPAGTPRDIVMTLNRHFVKALEHPSVKANIAAEGALPGGNTPEQFSAFIRSELEKYVRLVNDARLTPDS